MYTKKISMKNYFSNDLTSLLYASSSPTVGFQPRASSFSEERFIITSGAKLFFS